MAADTRRDVGERGESLAANHLRARGYELLERNFRTRSGELDIVARQGRTLVFCEVKARMGTGQIGPLASVGPRKRAQLRRMAREWLHERDRVAGTREIRFDAIGISLDGSGRVLWLDHIENAF